MIKKLRYKFIIISVCSTFTVLAIIVGALNIVTYQNIKNRADNILDVLIENDASFAQFDNKGKKDFSPETPYETRYFSVRLDDKKNVISVDTGKIVAVNTNTAINYSLELLETDKTTGFYKNYRYKIIEESKEILIVFIDVNREMTSFQTLLQSSILISTIGLLAVSILIVFFSKIVFKPVSENYEKQRRFITDASHELKTPLAIIQADVEVLEIENINNSWTNSIKNQINRLSSIIEQMVVLSKIDETNDLNQVEQFSLSQSIKEAIEPYEALIINEEKFLEIDIDSEYQFYGNKSMIKQMVSLLMDNAIKYSSKNGHIKISLVKKNKKYQLTLWNEADQLPKGDLDILFERFYRLDSSHNSSTGGSGIGLSIVKSIVEAHKGKITAKSDDGKSIVFTILLRTYEK